MRKVAVFVLLIGFCSLLSAGWEPLGPDGGYLRSIVMSPSNENNLYAASYSYPTRFVTSTDAGASWTETGSYNGYNYCLAIDPSENLYAGYYGVWKSTNGGMTWVQSPITNTYVYDLVVHPSNPAIIYGAGRKYISSGNYAMVFIQSTNSGGSWTTTTLVDSGYCYGYAIAVDPSNPNNIYVGGCGYGTSYEPKVFKSANGGATFSEVFTNTTGYYVYSLAVHPTNSDIAYFGTYTDGIYRTINGGVSWTKVSTYIYNYRLRTSTANPEYVYSSGYSAIYRSTNAGASWTTTSNGLVGSYCYGLAVQQSDEAIAYVANRCGCCKTTNAGSNWFSSNDGMNLGLPIVDATVAPSAPLTVYTQVEDIGVYKTTDCGSSWDLCPTFSSCGDMCEIAVMYTNPNTLMALEGLG